MFRQIDLNQFYRIEKKTPCAFSLASNKLRISVSNILDRSINIVLTFSHL